MRVSDLPMSDTTIADPGGGNPIHGSPSQVRPGQTFAGVAQAASGSVPGGRSWHKIFSDAKEKRNILEVQMMITKRNQKHFLFKVLKIQESDNIYFFLYLK